MKIAGTWSIGCCKFLQPWREHQDISFEPENRSIASVPKGNTKKVTYRRGQAAKIEGGFVLSPKEAPWLNTYLAKPHRQSQPEGWRSRRHSNCRPGIGHLGPATPHAQKIASRESNFSA